MLEKMIHNSLKNHSFSRWVAFWYWFVYNLSPWDIFIRITESIIVEYHWYVSSEISLLLIIEKSLL